MAIRRERPILDVYAERRQGRDPALVQDAQRIFEAMLFCTPDDQVLQMVGRVFSRPDEYRKSVQILREIASRRQELE